MKSLILSGGGSKAAFSVGALKFLIESGETYDLISGVSAGAICASFLAQYKDQKQGIKDLEELWLKINTKSIYKRWFLGRLAGISWKKGLYNNQPMKDLIKSNINPDKIKSSGKTLLIGSVCIDTSLYRQSDQQSVNLIDCIIASASIPLLFPPHSVEPGTFDVDGGIRNNAPISDAIKCGASHLTIICSDHLNLDYADTNKMKSFALAKRSIEIMADEIINNDINMFLATNNKVLNCLNNLPFEYYDLVIGNKKYIPNIIIKPNNILVKDSTIFEPKHIRRMIDEGYESAKKSHESKLNKK